MNRLDPAAFVDLLRPGLVAVPSVPQRGVCGICRSSAKGGYPTCYQCKDADLPPVLPITLSVHGDLVHAALRRYKDAPNQSAKRVLTKRLAALVALFLRHHSDCLGPWDVVVPVPSVKRCAPMAICEMVSALNSDLEQALVSHEDGTFTATRSLEGEAVLVLDDTFARGATLGAAVAALRQSGALIVGPLVIGRHIRRDWDLSAELLDWVEGRRWDERRCGRCAGEQRTEGSLGI